MAETSGVNMDALARILAYGTHKGKCQCTREFGTIPHCPSCGTTNVYGKASNFEMFPLSDGSKVYARGFRCRRCFTNFNEATPCEAPPPFENRSMKERRLKDTAIAEVGEIMKDPERRQAKLKEMFGKIDAARAGERGEAPNTGGAKTWTETNPMMEDVPKPPSDDESGKE